MTTARAFWDAIDRRKRERVQAEAAEVADLDYDDHDDEIGDELADREDRP